MPASRVKSNPKNVQGTNDSSSISKRSAERAGYFEEEQFLRPFIRKSSLRAPLINAGYYIRTLAIHTVIDKFLQQHTGSQVNVVSLGCGFEPSFFRLLARESLPVAFMTYVDVDFPALLKEKVDMMEKSLDLMQLVTAKSNSCYVPTDHRKSRSMEYHLLGCDLCQTRDFEQKLARTINTDLPTLFISEVSLIYMPPEHAKRVLNSIATFKNSSILILEQHIPQANTPFINTMLQHFTRKVKTPLRGLDRYPTLQSKSESLNESGWNNVTIQSLQQYWREALNDADMVKHARRAIDTELFDEWEELDLFLQHYCIAYATHSDKSHIQASSNCLLTPPQRMLWDTSLCKTPPTCKITRRGHSCVVFEQNEVMIFGGFGLSAECKKTDAHRRLASTEIYTIKHNGLHLRRIAKIDIEPCARLYHTCIQVGQKSILYGGRKSPDKALEDIWQFENGKWSCLEIKGEKPVGRFRHAACLISSTVILIHGGIDAKRQVLDDAWLFDTVLLEWTCISHLLAATSARHSHQLVASPQPDRTISILILGGLQEDVHFAPSCAMNLCSDLTSTSSFFTFPFTRYAHQAVLLDRSTAFIIGGVDPKGDIPEKEMLLSLDMHSSTCTPIKSSFSARLFVGHTLTSLADQGLLVTGGGMTAFSFGSCFDEEPLLLSFDPPYTSLSHSPPQKCQSVDVYLQEKPPIVRRVQPCRNAWQSALHELEPVVFSKCNLGPCTDLWNERYLSAKCGAHKVSIHLSQTENQLSWHQKNFKYTITTFGDLLDRAFSTQNAETVYLRSLSTSAQQPAKFKEDFPEIAEDFNVPDFLSGEVEQKLFSSPLRISSKDMGLWPHYDVQDNILCQIKGRKRVRLWPPSDADALYIQGSSSQITDTDSVDLDRFPLYKFSHPIETILEVGDVLFIPSCWIHAVSALEPSISVNCFFRNQDESLMHKSDVFGNCDLVPYVQAQEIVRQAIEKLRCLRPDQQDLYRKKLSMELQHSYG